MGSASRPSDADLLRGEALIYVHQSETCVLEMCEKAVEITTNLMKLFPKKPRERFSYDEEGILVRTLGEFVQYKCYEADSMRIVRGKKLQRLHAVLPSYADPAIKTRRGINPPAIYISAACASIWAAAVVIAFFATRPTLRRLN
ncbi:hypothetical protein B0H63DRAFT_524861 [Podospora didyma]|uniref:Uncharacterized protein n=1 Tax=Podospora didyma TaxID=330526 RepID=A0AAE0KJ00_9PEZI|nr:hypothetical protein B0H63DRAFT_524861 [Podospora didyma]